MWDNIKPDLLARLPRTSVNGKANGVHSESVLAQPQTDWDACVAKLEEYRSYTGDWDGQGALLGKPAKPIEGEMIDSAAALANALQRAGILAPHWTFPGVNGTVSFEWDVSGGGTITLEVTGPGTADYERYVPGADYEYIKVAETVTA